MKRGRFALVVGLGSLFVAATSFAVGLQVLDDGEPDQPPAAGSGDLADPTEAPADTTPTTTSTTEAPVTAPGELDTPAWVAVVASEGTQLEAEDVAAQAAAAGYPTGVLRSDDYPSLSGGHWVAYAGPYADAGAAEAAVDELADDGFDDAYVRCVGTKKECDADNKGRGNDDD